ncbi:hypothetical protein AWH48_11300 [Domibacillus aminovorans]|uniref:YHYH domain-containing protein n=1 Tax=Domibacillus aminovorans TaxID=29332 RepID=A0A177KMQ0_9BACI|nr:YHYH domain-containing protein [Domibacillus aminovorans]OAH53851.1 hypothetical protein AWH48_11300 [Domibacillus aminovorans]
MKKWVALFALLFLFWSYESADAHSGGTDSSGGHNCSEKSQAKGLCTGYHYHNGGAVDSGSSSSSDSSSSSYDSTQTTDSWDKDCTDFGTYEEVVEYWNANGYTRENDPEKLDGWGNIVDDGIPCEAPSSYDTSYVNGSDEQIARLAAEQAAAEAEALAEKETVQGKEDGFAAGVAAGEKGEDNNPIATGSDTYLEAYQSSYSAGYTEGFIRLEEQKEAAGNGGYELGKKQDKLVLPEAYQSNEVLKIEFETAFNKAVAERDEVKKKEYLALGLKDGKVDVNKAPQNVKVIYVESYNQGYKHGQEELKETYEEQGYEAAFTTLAYQKPSLENEKYMKWYEEGFRSNREVKLIQEAAYEMGLSGEEYNLPEKYAHAELIFKHYYESGKEEYDQNVNVGMGLFGSLASVWVGRRFYVARKMLK